MKKRHVYAIVFLILSLTTRMEAQVIPLSLNENPYGPSPAVYQRLEAEKNRLSRYTGEEGELLLKAIAQREGVSADQIVMGEILDQLGIYLGLKGGAGSEFIYSVPGYPVLVHAAARVGGKVISVPLNAKKENDLPALSKQVNERTQAIFLVNPHNPSGTVNDAKAFHDFIEKTSKKALVIVDEAYLEFTDDFQGRTAVADLKKGNNVMVFRTFAKAYGLAGLSIGYAVMTKELASYLKAQGLGNVHDLNRLSVVAALASLEDEAYLPKVTQQIQQERQKWNQWLDEWKVTHTNSQANFVYLDTKKPYTETEAAFTKAGIKIGRAFAPYETWIRITIGLPEENKKAQEVLKAIIVNK
ncbi:histidinol-phosphate transaminase [Siphonobacter sp. SORGH_AS_0500]|uniref:pyridoxal phosphate-dependent aminotransferase n=1 Tax=Siphonobacter sp. SORGH_AS_0500 TaxID=1864824 RepID=UPI002858A242|nr:histidinol-phosphate transaminase [Siphonobacter sp. SORGH_AS_0500]MDR6197833.1 histidinol-phosphate aminotransferase [Siphonobacter sp. SORGH_AS_0500]